jgi:uncharacterized protein (DUF433 family)
LTNTFTKPKLTNKEQKNKQTTKKMADYKALYEQQLAENNELKENLQQEKDGRCADLDELEAEIKELKEHIKDMDAVEEQLLEILQQGDVKDTFGDTYEELTYEMVPDILQCLIEEKQASETALNIVKEENETNKKNLQKFMNQAKLWETTAKNIEEKKEEETEDIEKLLKENEQLKKKILAR